MSQAKDQLFHFYKGWDVYQQQLVAAIAPLTTEQLALRSSPQNWSVGMIATHLVACRAWWFSAKMGEGRSDLADLELWDFGVCERNEDPSHTATELVAALETTWQTIDKVLHRWTPADLEQSFQIRSWNGEERGNRSRQWIIWHVLEHDIHHGGEISAILGGHGVAAVNLE